MNKLGLLELLENRGFSKPILKAFRNVKREDFVPDDYKSLAYENQPLPIGYEQTISQPSTIAVMFNLLQLNPGQKILEAGSGSGYVLALLSEIVGVKGQVYGLEIIKELADRSKETLKNYSNIHVFHGDGKLGLKEAPFDRILISAACSQPPQTLFYQLKDQGIFVAPVGSSELGCMITSFKREKDSFEVEDFKSGYTFVPFV